MLVVETVCRIRREHADGKPIKAIARDLRLSRKVVRKAIRAPEGAFDYRRKVQPLPRLGPFQERLDVLLTENEARPRRDRLRMTRIHDLLCREGFDGSYDAVRRYARRWAEARRKDPGDGAPAFIPLLFQPGEAYQFDWSHEDGWLEAECLRWAVRHAHPEQKELTVAEALELERPALQPILAPFDGFHETAHAVTGTCLIRLPPFGRCLRPDRNRYSVIAKAARRSVQVRAYADRIVVRLGDEVIAEHARHFGRDRTIYDPWHYLPVLANKPGACGTAHPSRGGTYQRH